jgi:DNA-binding response OmpR family regulator
LGILQIEKILVIEDENLTRKIIVNLLRKSNFNVIEATNSKKGLELASLPIF